MRSPNRSLLATLLLPLIAACGDDGSGPDRLTAAEVSAAYSICQLVFSPEGGLASVNLVQAGFETQASGVQTPLLRIDPIREIELVYTPKGQVVSQNVRGTFEVSGASEVTLRFEDRGSVRRSALLLPDRATLQFQPSPQSLSVASSDAYTVPRAEYARLSGQSETNLAEQIRGRLNASFRAGGCG